MNNIKILITLLAYFISAASAASQTDAASTDTGYTVIAAGGKHSMALKSDGSLWAWGDNRYGQLGDGSTAYSRIPKLIGTGYSAIAAGASHSMALKADGSLWAWGDNQYGQLGDGSTTNSRVPKQVGTDAYTKIAVGPGHNLALKPDGSLWAWGSNPGGQLGDGTTDSLVPKQIGTDSYTAISAGAGHSMALKPDGSLWVWGKNLFGQFGDGATTDSLVPKQIGTDSYAAITAGVFHSVAIKSDGTLWAWGGGNLPGLLGDGATTNSLVPKQIGLPRYTTVLAGAEHSLALKSDGSLWAWGNNDDGQLGYGTTTASLVPKQIGADSYAAIAAGGYHTIALKADGSLWAWGDNQFGQLGDGSTTDSLVPKQITGLGYLPDTTPPSVPTGLTATSTGAIPSIYAPVRLFWTPSTDDVAVHYYTIYRDGLPIDVNGNSYEDPGQFAGVPIPSNPLPTSSWTVSACDAERNCSAQSAAVSVSSSKQAPSAPAGLTATPVSASQINLAWEASADPMDGTQYEIYRLAYTNCLYAQPSFMVDCSLSFNARKLLATVSGGPRQTSYSDTGLSPSISYSYTVRACTAVNNCSATSAGAKAKTLLLPVNLRTPPVATGSTFGPTSNQTIKVTIAPPVGAPDLGAGTLIFVAAVVPPSMGSGTYLWHSGWTPFTGCADATASVWGDSATQQFDVVPIPTDLVALKGTKIYVGYGIGSRDAEACTDMLDNSSFTLAYTIN